MPRRNMLLAALLMLAGQVAAQSEKPPYTMPSPKGWARETIALPPSFAPEMIWKGAEEIRFAPGMFKPETDTFFSHHPATSGSLGLALVALLVLLTTVAQFNSRCNMSCHRMSRSIVVTSQPP